MSKILIVEDDRKTAELLRIYLEQAGYQVLISYDGQDGLEKAHSSQPDLVILDLMLPKIGGLEVCRMLRAEGNLPVIMLTALSTEDDTLIGLNLGADDYITKPFSPREVVARVRAVLRRSSLENSTEVIEAFQAGALRIDFLGHEVFLHEQRINLTPKEFKLLEIMVLQPGRAFSRAALLDAAYGHDSNSLERTVDVHIMNLRKKIEINPEKPNYIQTVYGVGYKFAEKPDA